MANKFENIINNFIDFIEYDLTEELEKQNPQKETEDILNDRLKLLSIINTNLKEYLNNNNLEIVKKDEKTEMKEIITIAKKLLNIANSYVTSYCETNDMYILNYDEIEEIEDEEEKENAKELKEIDIFLNKVAIFLKDVK